MNEGRKYPEKGKLHKFHLVKFSTGLTPLLIDCFSKMLWHYLVVHLDLCFFFKEFIDIQLLCNVVLVSAVQKRASGTEACTRILSVCDFLSM